jgi:hypothetical protein
MGCLSLPFKLLGSLAVLLALGIGWLYRDRLSTEVGRLLSRAESSDGSARIGRPGAHALGSAKSKVDSLNGWRADSVVLTPSEVASLIGAGLNASLRRQLDSLQVELQDGEIAINAKLATARLPRELTGPLALALREREPVQAAGPIAVVRPGRAEWKVRSFRSSWPKRLETQRRAVFQCEFQPVSGKFVCVLRERLFSERPAHEPPDFDSGR